LPDVEFLGDALSELIIPAFVPCKDRWGPVQIAPAAEIKQGLITTSGSELPQERFQHNSSRLHVLPQRPFFIVGLLR